MKFLHTADLHIGKVVNDFSMLEDQRYILKQISEIAKVQEVDAVLLAGDIYDRAIPAGEAVLLLDEFLTGLSGEGIWVFMISGNHDSPERLSFLQNLLSGQKIGIGGVYKDKLSVFRLNTGEEKNEIVLLPYVKPSQVNARTSEETVEKLLRKYWEEADKDENIQRLLITHYFVTHKGAEPDMSDSETTVHVGGLDNVEASLFEGFDYVALGHIHKMQQIGDMPVYYAGSPLKYSFGEVNTKKAVYCVELEKNHPAEVKEIPLRPMREMRKVKGTLQEILDQAMTEGEMRKDYIQAILTDENELIDPIDTLRTVYPNIMQIVKEEKGTDKNASFQSVVIKQKDPVTLFEDFYELVKDEKLKEKEKELIIDVMKSISSRER